MHSSLTPNDMHLRKATADIGLAFHGVQTALEFVSCIDEVHGV